jgi:putative heme-binding domain-containing protein
LLTSRDPSRWDALAAIVATGANCGALMRELAVEDANWLRSPTGERLRLVQSIGATMGRAPNEQRDEFFCWVDELPDEFVTGKVALQAGLARSQHEEARDRSSSRELVENPNPDRDRVVERYRESLSIEGDWQRGARHYATHCLSCHPVQGFGPTVGPDITSVASRPKQELLVDILDPSRRVSPDFVAYAAVTTKGVVTTGIIAAETEDSVTLRRERGEQVTFRLSDLVNLQPSHKSIMPDNVEAQLDVQALADLLAFLKAPARERIEAMPPEP